ncbi:hypothetical protein HJG60_010199 [Phyllostomus discolor]|uniref:Uncharacterized protein n=1 Tax=Phyllostomus discolor TaxID=89673 RepID=A0A834ASK6_9CHIR|nr:hypothetical protein HJG60_010199 [Phyllostomus discolor]
MWNRLVCQPIPCSPRSSSHCVTVSPLCPGCPSLSLLTWIHLDECFFFKSLVVGLLCSRFSVSSGCFLFLIFLLSFWLCEEAQYIYLRLHFGQESEPSFFVALIPTIMSSPEFLSIKWEAIVMLSE